MLRFALEDLSLFAAQKSTTMRALVCTILFATSASQPLQPPVHADEHDHRIGQLFFESTTALPGGAEQLWLAYGATPDAVGISWLTNATGAQSLVRYGTVNGSLTLQATGAASTYSCGAYSSGSIHRVNLTGLAPATTYFYQVGDDSTGASTVRSFKSAPVLGSFPYTFGVIGDLGQTNFSADTVAHVAASSTVDSVFIVGDVSYADSDQPRWDSFQRL